MPSGVGGFSRCTTVQGPSSVRADGPVEFSSTSRRCRTVSEADMRGSTTCARRADLLVVQLVPARQTP